MLELAEKDGEDSLVLGAGNDGVIKVWDLMSGSLLHSLEGHYSTVTGVILSFKLQKIVRLHIFIYSGNRTGLCNTSVSA